MLKNIVNLDNTRKLNREEQNLIKGGNGFISCRASENCPPMFPICSDSGFCERNDC
ncbi:hypothetical protein [Aquimarina sp. 2201CG5-10]|uniref:hypothetical protein n=1 Tax=Aquimarina callyspongiae TaxID=3098150 RepID=UPI002AB38DBF|nr:hypothetical protein [Aquimarina sp. 2201CG5-10]MDY8138122.1 hypothetical protein [Aquimarina sp. 2201CG5-10]